MKKKQTLIIAEAGINHNGNLKRALQMVKIAKECGADIIKFQTAIPESLVTKTAPLAEYQKINQNKNLSQLNMIKKYCLSFNDFKIIKKKCDKIGIEFLTSAFDNTSLKFIKSLKPIRYKIPSGEITNIPFLKKIAKFNKKIILSTGMSNNEEIEYAIKIILSGGTKRNNITLLQCTSSYPTPMGDVNLRVMDMMKKRYSLEVGLSDHTLGIEVPIAAVAMGATTIEKHFTVNRNLSGPDHFASLDPKNLKKMIESIRNVEIAKGMQTKKISKSEIKNIKIGRKSIVASKKIMKGEIFTKNNLTIKRPGIGISPKYYDKILGKKANFIFEKDDLIKLK
ncbi:MAG: N,N'-diacetyllegionaminic acid synthase [Alphaproteobacteria bacterium MarineAlpha5_Bin8]|nr:MAG: N,N'-diacetyllegionaminic acid synthase [Alphaproteobacteria bacterium MarineAlpha5_Bin8]PPR54541.1 MAG: N,N'-diacetyllegionaminic acid synthase [Alphaproteobacteria bacterium MarineAlpha5_Bin6]|tara:strand:- start:1488 stop:2501 length:1014 start_codon:yes stop_codon:yes gene_type:complete